LTDLGVALPRQARAEIRRTVVRVDGHADGADPHGEECRGASAPSGTESLIDRAIAERKRPLSQWPLLNNGRRGNQTPDTSSCLAGQLDSEGQTARRRGVPRRPPQCANHSPGTGCFAEPGVETSVAAWRGRSLGRTPPRRDGDLSGRDLALTCPHRCPRQPRFRCGAWRHRPTRDRRCERVVGARSDSCETNAVVLGHHRRGVRRQEPCPLVAAGPA
jgi:hypothetical protein